MVSQWFRCLCLLLVTWLLSGIHDINETMGRGRTIYFPFGVMMTILVAMSFEAGVNIGFFVEGSCEYHWCKLMCSCDLGSEWSSC